MDSCKDTCGFHRWVSPFRNLRITACLRLPEAYRSLPRLSSALSAKASALRPSLLNLLYSPQNDKSFWLLHSHHKQSSVVVHDYNCLSIFRSTTYHCFGKQQSHFCSDEQNQSCCFDVCLFLYSVFKVPKHVASNVLKLAAQASQSGYLSTSRMETKRFELSTPCLQGRCSPN